MKWMKATALLVFLMLSMACSKRPVANSSSPLDPSIEAILAKMTTKEKVGQMTQLNIDAVCVGEIYKLEEPHRIDSAKLHKAIVDYGVGSILNCGGHAYPREQWIEMIGTIQRFAQDKSRLGIPVIYGIDAIHGANYVSQSTLFPQPLAQAATFNRSLVEKAAEITAYESRAAGMTWNFSPVLDVARTPLWSRVFETYGEDPLVCAELGTAAVRGYQQCSTPMAACMKHFLGYSAPRSGKDRTPAWIPDNVLRELFLPPFERAVQQGALTVMINSGELNGVPVHASKKILTDLLRNELKFEGIAVTDWEDVMKLHLNHRVAENLKEATFIAVEAGIDMCMVPNDYNFSDHLLQLVEEGRISEERLNTSVRRILTVKKKLGLLENAQVPKITDYPKFASKEHKNAALQAATECITLLENKNNVLPLSKSSKVFLTGPAAHSMSLLNGAWSRTWQGVDTTWDDRSMLTIYESFLQKGIDVRYRKGVELNAEVDAQQAVKEAAESDVIVVCVGEKPSTEKVGDIHDLSMSPVQIDYVLQLIATGKPVVVVLVENRPLLVNAFADKAAAMVMAFLPGDFGGEAIANILFGDACPTGKLPITYPRYNHDLFTYDHKFTETVDSGFGNAAFQPQWQFGHGLSYATLSYSHLTVRPFSNQQPWPVSVNVTITNSSDFEVNESVLLFVNDKFASVTPSVKKLRAFEKVKVPAQGSVDVSLPLEEKDLMMLNAQGKWIYEPGEWEVQIEQLSQKLILP